ncbi:MAG: prepilin-type N-terminal cleavage/methylation domain-containing protein [Xanthomonadales bacterium]|nr:prepilin-type N-terminal cleavage/methylation domain-containing protein [Xanthomonadales bacterium]
MSATGSTEARIFGHRSGGFSLLELLVAMAIAAALVGVAMLAAGGGIGERRGEQEMQRLSALMQLVCDRALIEGRVLGFALSSRHFQPYELAVDGWRPMVGEAAYRSAALPERWELRLGLEGAMLKLPDSLPLEPQLLCLPDGQSTPFRLALYGPDGQGLWRLRGDGSHRRRVLEDLSS